MLSLFGATRPAFTRKVLWIAAAAIFLVLAWANAGFPYPPNPYYITNPDGTLGMMPPDKYGAGGRKRFDAPITITQVGNKGQTFEYVATNNNGTYTITRNGKPFVTIVLNKSTGLWELGDSNGTGSAVIKVGYPKAGPMLMSTAPPSKQ